MRTLPEEPSKTRTQLETIENPYTLQRNVQAFQVTAEVFGAHNMHREGDLAAVLAQMDPADITGLTVSNSRSQAHVSVRLGRSYLDDSAALIKVSGADPQWVSGAFEQLVSEVSKDVPAWAGLRRHALAIGAGIFAVSTFIGVLIVLQGVNFSAQGQRISPVEAATVRIALAILSSLVAAFVGAGVFALLRRWVLVPFEVLEPGQKSTARRIGGTVGWVIGVASGLIAIGGVVIALLPPWRP